MAFAAKSSVRHLARLWMSCICIAAIALTGCVALLPTEATEVSSPWHSFDDAKAAVTRIVPFETTRADLLAAKIDPYQTPNIALLTYSDIILRFPIGGSVPNEKLDRGLRECLNAGQACSGYAISVRDMKRDRTANFWLDSLHFYRRVDVSGWSFNAVILLVEDRVVYMLYGGQPMIREREETRQPLGPVQNWGDAVPGILVQ
jgi:hypothetical protein